VASFLRNLFSGFDLWLFAPALVLSLIGLSTMYTFHGDNGFFSRQLVWISLALTIMFLSMVPDYRFLRSGHSTFYIYLSTVALLVLVLLFGEVTLGARSRFDLGFFSFQPAEFAKLVLIAVLAKYFSKRHEMIGDFKHIVVSGLYTFAVFALVFVQPDFGSALIILSIWFGLVLVSGIRLRHLSLVIGAGALVFILLGSFVFLPL